jgi:hypothetical protein
MNVHQGNDTGGGTDMLRKLALSTITLTTAAVALASSAAASIPVDPGSGSAAPAPVPSSPGGFPWGDVGLGILLALAVAACLVGIRLVARSRRLAASH